MKSRVNFCSWWGSCLGRFPPTRITARYASWLYCALLSEALFGVAGRFPWVQDAGGEDSWRAIQVQSHRGVAMAGERWDVWVRTFRSAAHTLASSQASGRRSHSRMGAAGILGSALELAGADLHWDAQLQEAVLDQAGTHLHGLSNELWQFGSEVVRRSGAAHGPRGCGGLGSHRPATSQCLRGTGRMATGAAEERARRTTVVGSGAEMDDDEESGGEGSPDDRPGPLAGGGGRLAARRAARRGRRGSDGAS